MPPTKRTRPAFSPPRPGKSTSKTTASDNTAAKKRSRVSTTSTTTKPKPKQKAAVARKRKRTPSPHNSSSAPSSPTSSTHDNDDDDEEEEEDAVSRDTTPADTDPYATADGMLVEITNEDAPQPSIPLGLIHRIMLEHWAEDETEKTTKLSGDAREVLGAYVDTFVREAVARAAFEAGERELKNNIGGETTAAAAAAAAGTKGWLDVEDLERVGGGLVLDF